MPKPTTASYLFFAATLVLVGFLQLTTPFLTILFSFLVLRKLHLWRRKWVAIVLFLILVAGAFTGFVFFLKRAFVELPEIAGTSIPMMARFAERHGIELPFTDVGSLKGLAMESVSETLGFLGNFVKIATKEFVFLLMGLVVAIGIFVNPSLDWDCAEGAPAANAYSFYCARIMERFRAFYTSFEKVIGAQALISGINTLLTAIFAYAFSLRYATIAVIITFICGLLPVVGNLISNTIIVGIAFTMSPKMALTSLIFLVVVHKLEYFLNSRIIGSRIRHPMWLMLLSLVVGERLMGVPGIILAPVFLHFIKLEALKASAPGAAAVTTPPTPARLPEKQPEPLAVV